MFVLDVLIIILKNIFENMMRIQTYLDEITNHRKKFCLKQDFL